MKKFKTTYYILLGTMGLLSTHVFGAKLYFQSADELIKSCNNEIDIMIDTEGEDIVGAAVDIDYNTDALDIVAFYPNEIFNLPLQHHDVNGFRGALLHQEFDIKSKKRVGFHGIIKYGTIVIRDIEQIDSIALKFVYTTPGDSSDNTSIYAVKDGRDIATQYLMGTFKYVDGKCKNKNISDKNNLLNDAFSNTKLIENSLNTLQATDDIDNLSKRSIFAQTWGQYIIIGLLIIMIILVEVIYGKKQRSKKSDKKKSTKK